MLNILSLLTTAVWLLLVAPRTGRGSELIRNGSFEEGAVGHPAPGWKGVTISNQGPLKGAACGHRKEGYGTQLIAVSPSTSYLFSLYVKSVGAGWTVLEVISQATGEKVIDVSQQGRFEWQHWKRWYTTRPDETGLTLYLGWTAGNYWDNVSVRDLRDEVSDAVFYVSPVGDDRGPGSAKQPWRQVARAAARLKPGQTLRLKPGLYRETVPDVPSGVPGHPVTFAAEGKGAVFDGGGKLRNAFQGSHFRHVRFSGLEIRNYTSEGLWLSAANDLILRNCIIHHNGNHTQGEGNGVYGWGDGWIIENCWVFENCPSNRFLGSGLCTAGYNFVIRNNRVESNRGNGILVEDGFNYVVEGNTCRFNRGDGGGWGCGGIWVDGGYNVIVRHNWFEGNEWAGILLSDEDVNDPFNYTVYSNVCVGNWYGMWVGGLGRAGRVNRLYNNTLVDNTHAGLWFSNISYGPNCNLEIFNNIMAQISVNAPALIVDGQPGPNCWLDYNIYYRSPALDQRRPSAGWRSGPTAPGTALGAEVGVPLIWRGRDDVPEKKERGNCYSPQLAREANADGVGLTLEQYQKRTGFGAHSFNVDPRFLDPRTRNYRLRPDSPCIDAGSNGYVPDRDYAGSSRPMGFRVDIGAYECGPRH